MEIYVDVIVAENLVIDLFLLLLTVKLLRYEYNPINLYVSALFGGVFTLSSFTNIFFLNNIITKISVGVIMVVITVHNRSIMKNIKAVGVFYLLSFTLCGICFGTVEIKNTYSISDGFSINNYSIKWIGISLMLLYVIATRIYEHLKERAVIKNFIYDIYISFNNDSLLLKGFLDTGNELREPATNLPCIIIENQYFNDFKVSNDQKLYISYNTISENDRIFGFKGDIVKIKAEDQGDWQSINAVICGCNTKLSKENDFQALLSRGVI